MTSWQHATHPLAPGERVFSRDLLEVEVYDAKRRRRLLTLFTTHLKSQYVPFGQDEQSARAEADERRRRQAETVARIVRRRTRPDGRHLVCGDLNDSPGSAALAPLTHSPDLELVDALADPRETRPPKPDQPRRPGRRGPTVSSPRGSRRATSCTTRSGSAPGSPPAKVPKDLDSNRVSRKSHGCALPR